MSNWSLKRHPHPDWPLDAEGNPVSPMFLEHITGSQLDVDVAINVLTAYGIPVFVSYPNDGDFGRLILGFSGTGADIYVPATMIDDACNIISCDMETALQEQLDEQGSDIEGGSNDELS